MRGKKRRKDKKNTDFILVFGIAAILLFSLYLLFSLGRTQAGQNTTTTSTSIAKKMQVVRKSVIAGSWYPAEKKELEKAVEGYLSEAKANPVSNLHALIVPHAGYAYSAPVAAYGYKLLSGKQYDTIIIIGPDHNVGFSGAWIPDVTHFETPLGLVEVSEKADELRKNSLFTDIPESKDKEHSVEIQLPFLQKTLKPGFKIVPIVAGQVKPDELAAALEPFIDERTLVITSSDLSHYHAYEEAVRLDEACSQNAPKLKIESMDDCEACGITQINALLYIARSHNWTGELLDYRNSGDTAGDKSRVVGYMTVAFFEGMDKSEQDFLLKLARRTLEEYYETGSTKPEIKAELSARLLKESGCFVTLNENQQLRGCIGHIMPQKPLYECVIENALSAALHDPRFKPVEKRELEDIRIDVSVLTAPKKLDFKDAQDLLDKLTPMQDGVVLRYGRGSATYLPQVWEQLPDKKIFLSSLCEKSGNAGDCWIKKPGISLYQAQVFGE